MNSLINKWKKLNKFVRISICIVLGVTAYRCADFFPHTYMWLTHHPQMYNAELEPEFPSWFSVNFESLEGPDTNKNGIRDDVEIYMNREFEDLGEGEVAILHQYARMIQNRLKYPVGHEYSKKHWEERKHLYACIFILTDIKAAASSRAKYKFMNKDKEFVFKKVINSLSRDLKEARFMRQFNGGSTVSDSKMWNFLHLEEQCHFTQKYSDALRKDYFIEEKKVYGKYGERFYDYYERIHGKSKRYLYEDYID
ncbi:hypothetical protein [Halobacteriovorax sp.]|uniref:hypothetical protein n=1 Tax=Halobacteriovorax sp. TaxID=2020862 RepID=UPI0035656CAA